MALATVLVAANAHADDKFTLNGFGYQDYRQANANSFEGADQRGTWGSDILAFVLSAKISDCDTAWAQLETEATEPTLFTWAFFDHRFNDNLAAHIGRVKFPFGIYKEFIDNRWLQISAVQPSMYLGASDMTYDAYGGIGLDWTSGSWFTQVYAGNTYNNPSLEGAPPVFLPPTYASIAPSNDRRLIGGRVTWNTQYEGLCFLVSAFEVQGESTAQQPTLGQLNREYQTRLSLDYVSDRFDIKSEYNSHNISPVSGYAGVAANAWYVQGGYKMNLWCRMSGMTVMWPISVTRLTRPITKGIGWLA